LELEVVDRKSLMLAGWSLVSLCQLLTSISRHHKKITPASRQGLLGFEIKTPALPLVRVANDNRNNHRGVCHGLPVYRPNQCGAIAFRAGPGAMLARKQLSTNTIRLY
jgi:hypothetical protein